MERAERMKEATEDKDVKAMREAKEQARRLHKQKQKQKAEAQ
jgi:hypothetical protein